MKIRDRKFAKLTTDELHDILKLRIDVFVAEQACAYPELDGRDTEPTTRHVWMADDVGVGTAVVLGLSLGGMIAQQLAVDHPDRVRALVSLASTTGELDLPAASDEVVAALTAPVSYTHLTLPTIRMV